MPYADVHLVKVKILFVFRFSLFVFLFSLFDNRSDSGFYCLVSEYMSECVSERVSELENEWVIYVNQTAHAISRHSFRQSLDSFCSSLFAFHFLLFVFRFSLFDHRAVSCCYCYLRTWIRECLSEWVSEWVSGWVRKLVSECITSIKQLMPYADVHLVKVKILFDFRFSFFAFRFSIICLLHAFTVWCLSTRVSECVSERVSELESKWVFYVNQTAHAICRHSFRQCLDSFCLLLFVFRFSFFAFRFSIIGLCHVVTVICVHEYVSVWVSELENEWVFYVNQTAHAICRHSFRQSLDSFCFSLFVFRFSFFAFRFSIIGLCHVVTVICVHEYVSVWVSAWVS